MQVDDEVSLKFWARAFTRELDFPSTMDGFEELSHLLEGTGPLVPLQFAELSSEGLVPRVAVTDTDRTWTVQVTGQSLDVVWEFKPGANGTSFPEYCERAANQLGRILDSKDAKAHRVAVVWDRLLPILPPEQLQSVSGKFLRLPMMFAPDPFEWDWRVAARRPRSFGGDSELTNTLATLKRMEVRFQGQRSDRLFLQTDVNTDSRNLSARFSGTHVREFVKSSPPWHDEVATAVLGQLRDEP